MKLLCVGYPKTSTKSASNALRQLGYNVCDYMETLEFTSIIWAKFIEGRATIEDVIAEHNRHGFDCQNDIPGMCFFEEMYTALGRGTKVILTVRDDVDTWYNSWTNFMIQEGRRDAIGDFSHVGISIY